MVMPWGKHKGVELRDVPGGYLFWALEEATLDRSLRRAIKSELARRFAPTGPSPAPSFRTGIIPAELRAMAKEIVKSGFRRVALVHHPDHGGTSTDMQRVLAACRALEALLDLSPVDTDTSDMPPF
jgi:hypothetical protein